MGKLLFFILIGIACWSELPGYNSVFPQQVKGPYILLEALPDPSREINDAFSKKLSSFIKHLHFYYFN